MNALDVGQPIGLFELALLHVIANMHHVEARASRTEFDNGFLPLLLLRGLLGRNLNPRQVGEFLLVLLQNPTARAFDEVHPDLRAGEFLPVHIREGGRDPAQTVCGSRCRACEKYTSYP
jgi:hypothetical protein